MIDQSPDRLNTILDALTEARKSLENWQDQRTQALINLDSFAYDVRLIQEEKNQILEEYEKAQKVFFDRENSLQNNIVALNDEVSKLTLKNEGLVKELETARIQIAAAKAETEKQIHAQKLLEEKNQIEIARVKADAEAKGVTARRDDGLLIEKLNHQIQSLMAERDRQLQHLIVDRDREAARAKRIEIDLQNLRTQIQAVLNGTPLATGSQVQISTDFNKGGYYPEVTQVDETTKAPEKPARELVQDYLKRLGY